MKTFLFFVTGALLAGMMPAVQAADPYTLFQAKASLTVTKTTFNQEFFTFKASARTFATSDVINLALGRPIGTKVTEVLALAVFVEGPGVVATPKTELIVCQIDKVTKVITRVATVATITDLEYSAVTLPKSASKGQGIGTVQIVETPAGGISANNKFFPTTLRGAAIGKATASTTAGELNAFAVATTGLAGPVKVRFTTTRNATAEDFEGIAIKSAFSAGRKLGVLTF